MKKIKFKLKLILKPGKANPSPPIGPILGQYNINIISFCKLFNEITKDLKVELINVKLLVYENNNFKLILNNCLLSLLIKNEIKIVKFSKKPNIENINKINIVQINKILYIKNKIENLNVNSIRKSIIGTIISMGINYEF